VADPLPDVRAEELVSVTRWDDFMELSMHNLGTAEGDNALALLVEDEEMARHSPARLLITARTQHGVETLARRVHEAGPRAQFPLVYTWARDLPVKREALKESCASLLAAAAGGSVLISAVEEMPRAVQDALSELLAGLGFARRPSAEVRLISGTTVSLLDRVAAGTFCEHLFYRLNVIHLMAGDNSVQSRGRTTPWR
jgi:sigma-54 dependent transcriptional regulator, acetoin dehydrogenase operon transcriptional activator AcoR